MKIKKIYAREVLDSRGNPTIEAEVTTDRGFIGRAIVPSGASTGTKEALELRDGDINRYGGKGVLKAVQNVNNKIAKVLIGTSAASQKKIDQIMIDFDGTESKESLGANAILAVSLACARAAANERKLPLYKYISKTFKSQIEYMPTPMMNIINGGEHADNGIDFQEFMIIPVSMGSFARALQCGSEVFHALKKLLANDGYSTAVGDEGGFAPNLKDNEMPLVYIVKAIEEAGYIPGIDVVIGIDVAASEMYYAEKKKYKYKKKLISSSKLLKIYKRLIEEYPIVSIEDPFSEFDWDATIEMTSLLGQNLQIIGDDNFVTNAAILEEGIERGSNNSILIKINQIGTLTETFATIQLARENGYTTVISHRSGETEDTSIADLAVGWNLGQIKTGSLSRTERISKYNQLLRIEEQSGLKYAGSKTIKNYTVHCKIS